MRYNYSSLHTIARLWWCFPGSYLLCISIAHSKDRTAWIFFFEIFAVLFHSSRNSSQIWKVLCTLLAPLLLTSRSMTRAQIFKQTKCSDYSFGYQDKMLLFIANTWTGNVDAKQSKGMNIHVPFLRIFHVNVLENHALRVSNSYTSSGGKRKKLTT